MPSRDDCCLLNPFKSAQASSPTSWLLAAQLGTTNKSCKRVAGQRKLAGVAMSMQWCCLAQSSSSSCALRSVPQCHCRIDHTAQQ
jgi:hypothetical protein